ncbi:MAG: nucleotidyltransferase family protein [bacterium]
MNSAQEVNKLLSAHKKELVARYGVSKLGIFGSWVRGEQRPDSDIDLLVEFSKPIGLLKFVNLENYLSELTGQKVDLVMKSALKTNIGRHILAEVEYLKQ